MIRDFRYIIKKIIILTSVAILVYLFKAYIVSAASLEGTLTWGVDRYSTVTIKANDYKYVPASSPRMFWFTGLAEEDAPTTYYFNVLLCVNSEYELTGSGWSESSLPNSSTKTIDTTSMNITNVPCKFVGAYPGKVAQITGATQAVSGDLSIAFNVSFNQNVSYQLISYQLSNEPYDYISSIADFDSLNTSINNQTNELKSWLQFNNQSLQTGFNNAIAKQEELINTISQNYSDDIDSSFQNQKISEISNKSYNNTSISHLILLPLRIMNGMVDALDSDACTPFNLGTFYNQSIVLPCITSSQMTGWLGNTYNIIDLFIAFGVILGIRSVCIKIYKTIIFMKEGSID